MVTTKLKGLPFMVAFLIALYARCIDAQLRVKPAEINDFLKEHNKDDSITYNQLKLWFEDQQASGGVWITKELFPRLFAFCVTYEQVMNYTHLNEQNSHLSKYADIFERIDTYHNIEQKFYHFNISKHSVVQNKTFVRDVRVSRITTPEYDMLNLRQWVHITVETTPLKGLYIQSITGPVGLPNGEFSLEFPCADAADSHDLNVIGQLEYCHYRPKANIQHPNVYVGYSSSPRNTWHVHFHWTDITCMETPYFQFIMIAVKNFVSSPREGEDYQLIMSQVFLNTDFDSQDGSPYPYYPAWEKQMHCIQTAATIDATYLAVFQKSLSGYTQKVNGDSRFSPLLFKDAHMNPDPTKRVYRIQPNEEYDACLRGVNRPEILIKKDDYRLECPPGPFQCTKSYQDQAKGATSGSSSARSVPQARQDQVDSESKTSECYPCAAPPCLDLAFPPEMCLGAGSSLVTRKDVNVLEKLETVARTKSHGMLAALSTLVLLPIANFIGRSYKEVCRNCLCGNGPWIFIHIIFHIISAITLWISIGPVVSAIANYKEVLEECQAIHNNDNEKSAECAAERSFFNPHVPLGIAVFLFQNLSILFGFFRSQSSTLRTIQLVLHSHVGYLTFILAGIAALVATKNNQCTEITILMGALFVIPFIFFAVACVIDIMADKQIGIVPGRKQYPILEPIKLDKRGPCECCKWIVFILFIILLMVVWFCVIASTNISSRQAKTGTFNPSTADSLADAFTGDNGKLEGVFGGVCGGLDADNFT